MADGSLALRGSLAGDAPRRYGVAVVRRAWGRTRSVEGCIPTRSVGTIRKRFSSVEFQVALLPHSNGRYGKFKLIRCHWHPVTFIALMCAVCSYLEVVGLCDFLGDI